ncbi:hypothetical protein BDZ97DRAFT_1933653 [Flammula alnicola]|nr:hypothetical protein BDZ97DRAFT_1933653 [Flammula alnicola]
MPLYEIITFPASEAFVADSATVLKAPAEFLSTVDGLPSVFAGLAEEEKTGFIVAVGDLRTPQSHDPTPGYPQIVGFGPAFASAGERSSFHVDFIADPKAGALTAPTTEVMVMTLKEGKTKDDLAAVLAVLGPKITAAEGAYEPLAWGETREEPGKKFYLFLGWESTKRHFEVVGESSYETPIHNLFGTVDIKMVHASFKRIV